MTIKEFIVKRIHLFFFLVTLILTAQALVGTSLAPEQELHYYNLFSPMILAGLCILPTCVTYYRKEPSAKQYLIRRAIQLILIEGIILMITAMTPDMNADGAYSFIIIGTAVLIIYSLVMLIMWYQQYLQSKELNKRLQKLQTDR